jgi:hypothetical protein
MNKISTLFRERGINIPEAGQEYPEDYLKEEVVP